MATKLDPDATETIETFVRGRLAEDGLPGLSLAITDADELIYAAGFGSRNLVENEPATAETIYGMGSVSKSFASLAVATLVDDGLMDFDAPLVEYLDVDVPEDVTIHHLLSHTSGYPSLATSEALIARQLECGEAGVPLGGRSDFLAHVEGAREEIADDPGDRWMYCNSGYNLVGEAIAAVTGQSYVEYVESEILAPLGMDRSTYDGEAFADEDDRMTPYFPGEDGPEPSTLPIREQSAAAGGLLAPVTEMTSYLRLHLNGGVEDGRRLVDAETLERCYGAYAETPSGPYGYGWRTREVLGTELVGHGGSIAVSTAYVGFNREDALGIALAANGSPGYGLAMLGEAVFAALTGHDPESLPFFEREAILEELTGEYESYRGIKEATVTRRGGVLEMALGGPIGGDPDPMVLVPEDLEERRFSILATSGVRSPVTFEQDDGEWNLYYDRWRLHQV